jgi:putative tricarboxylic transport membrane protein
MKNPDQLSSLFWLIVGVGISAGSVKYGVGNFLSPGAGFITFFAGIVLSLLSVLLFIFSLIRREPRQSIRSLWEGLAFGKVIYVIVLLMLYALTLQFLGFLPATLILLFFLFRIKGTYSPLTVVVLSLVISLGAYLVFQVWLQVQLPKGILQGII